MKALHALLAVLLLASTALPSSAELVTDPVTGLRTGTITANGQTYTIEPNANLIGANLSQTVLARVDLRGADLSGANLNETELWDSNLTGANLTGCDLIGASLGGAIFTDAIGTGIKRGGLEGLILDRFTALEEQVGDIQIGGGIAPEQAAAIEANTAKTGITIEQAARIEANRIELSAVKTLLDVMTVQLQQLNTRVGDLQASIVEKDEQIAELSQRPTVEELQDARTGSLVLSADQETNLVTLEFEIQESDNLRDWVSRPEKVTTTVPLGEGKRFVRIALSK